MRAYYIGVDVLCRPRVARWRQPLELGRQAPQLTWSASHERVDGSPLPGGAAWDMKKNSEAAQLAAEFIAAGVPVAAICGATVLSAWYKLYKTGDAKYFGELMKSAEASGS